VRVAVWTIGLPAFLVACGEGAGGAGGVGAGGGDAAFGGAAGGPSAGGGSANGGGRAGGAGGAAGAGGECDPGGAPQIPTTPPAKLSETGLYADIASETLASGVEPFAPKYVLWSDGGDKQRFVSLPPCSEIDTSDMDHWSLPVGTRLWKTFVVGGVRVETRLIARYGPAPGEFWFAAYQWNDDQTDADHAPLGVEDAKGTEHDIPATSSCKLCHEYLEERALGFGAIQLSHGGPGVTIASLSAAGRLSVPAPSGFDVPGDPVEAAALGYLHANCGNCHNDTGVEFNDPFALRVLVGDATVEATGAFGTAVGVPVEKFVQAGVTHRIAPGQPGASCVWYRMGVRGTIQQMPPLATELVDDSGLAIVEAWIQSLP